MRKTYVFLLSKLVVFESCVRHCLFERSRFCGFGLEILVLVSLSVVLFHVLFY